MTELLSEAGRSFLRAFIVTFIFAATGLFAAPNVKAATALSIAALVAALAAGLKSIQSFIPALTFSRYVPAPYGAMVDSFVRTFLGTLVVGATGWLAAPNLDFSRAAWWAILGGALTAAFRALQGFLTPGQYPVPEAGFSVPGTPEKVPVERAAA